ncbi:MAG: acyltransferase family protein [Actinomycetota bacterium]
MTRSFRIDIQILRGLSVLAVVFFHAKQSITPAGYLGVDVFFVISGFVVTPLIIRIFQRDQTQSLRANWIHFYRRRFLRLVPALGAALSFSAVLIFLFASPLDFNNLAHQGFATLLLVGNFGAYSFSGNYFLPHPNPLVHTWSLSVEEQFYFFLPIVIYLFVRGGKAIASRTLKVFAGIISISIVFFAFPEIAKSLLTHFGLIIRPEFAFYSPLSRVWEFALGGVLFLIKDSHLSGLPTLKPIFRLITPLLLIALLFAPVDLGSRIGPIFACLLAVGSISTFGFDLFGSHFAKLFVWLGDRSYSIYLLHMPLMFVAKYSPLGHFGTNRAVPTFVALILSFVLGHFSYSKIEGRYRYRSEEPGRTHTIHKLSLIFILVPSLLFGSILAISHFHPLNLAALPINGEWGAYPDNDCKKKTERNIPCIYGTDASRKTVLLIGDSHAQMLGQAVQNSAVQSNWNVVLWGESACAFEIGDLGKPAQDDCEKANRERLDWMIANKPDAVIISMYVLREATLDSYKNTFMQLRQVVPNVLIVLTDPIFPDNDEFVNVRPVLNNKYEAPKSLPIAQMLNGDGVVNAEYSKWAVSNGFSVVDPTRYFCDEVKCWRYANGEWLYMDDDHLSVTGAKLLIPDFNKFLSSVSAKSK